MISGKPCILRSAASASSVPGPCARPPHEVHGIDDLFVPIALFTSPRLRGEVDARSASGEGDSRWSEVFENPPHPDPLPASGERELSAVVATASIQLDRAL